MAEQLENSTILIELDALLDTRISTLASMGDGSLEAAMNCDYFNRTIDMFPKVDNVLFAELYANRTKKVLAETMVTPMGALLLEFCEKTLTQVISTPFHYKPKVIINIFPYEFNEEEILELLNAITVITRKLCDVEIISMSYEQITPAFVKQHVSVMILYEYYKWLEIHSVSEAFKKTTCPEVTLFGPRIYFKMKDNSTSDDSDPFKAMEMLAAPFIGLKLIPIENFCLVFNKATEA